MGPRLTGLPHLADWATCLGGLSHLSCIHDQIKIRDYMERRVTTPTWGPPPPCKQALTDVVFNNLKSSSVKWALVISLKNSIHTVTYIASSLSLPRKPSPAVAVHIKLVTWYQFLPFPIFLPWHFVPCSESFAFRRYSSNRRLRSQ